MPRDRKEGALRRPPDRFLLGLFICSLLFLPSCIPWVAGEDALEEDPTVGGEGRIAPSPDPPEKEDDAPQPRFHVRIGDEERERLLDETRREIGRAEELLSSVRREDLGGNARETFRTADDLLSASRAALGEGDPSSAAELARKARILAEELARRTEE